MGAAIFKEMAWLLRSADTSVRQNAVPKVVIFGFMNSGKTSLLSKMVQQSRKMDLIESKSFENRLGLIESSPTIGFNVEEIGEPDNVLFHCWEISGFSSQTEQWQSYLDNTEFNMLIYVIDIDEKDENNVEKNEQFITSLKEHPSLKNKPIVCVLNKIDLNSKQSFSKYLHIEKEYKVIKTSCKTGIGIQELLNWVYHKSSHVHT